MSDLTPCPTCQSMLRIPAGAAMIRCPKCKTVLAVEPAAVTTTAPMAQPVPPPAAPPPLPFGRPTAAPIAPVAQVVAITPGPSGPPVRAQLAPVQADDPPPAADDKSAEAERRRKLRRELKRLEERERREEERFERLKEECKQGRMAMALLMWGTRAFALAVLMAMAGVFATVLADPGYGGLIGLVCAAFGGIGILLLLGGFGFAIAGPRKGRHIGVMGIGITLVHAGLVGVQFLKGLAAVGDPKLAPELEYWGSWLPILNLMSVGTDLSLLAEHPARFLKWDFVRYPVTYLGIVAAALEFTRLVLVCLLTQIYAAEGKDVETGHRSINTVSNVFWIVLLAGMFRVSAAFGFDWATPDDLWFKVGAGAHAALTLGCLVGIAVAYLRQSQVIHDTAEVVDERRYIVTADRID